MVILLFVLMFDVVFGLCGRVAGKPVHVYWGSQWLTDRMVRMVVLHMNTRTIELCVAGYCTVLTVRKGDCTVRCVSAVLSLRLGLMNLTRFVQDGRVHTCMYIFILCSCACFDREGKWEMKLRPCWWEKNQLSFSMFSVNLTVTYAFPFVSWTIEFIIILCCCSLWCYTFFFFIYIGFGKDLGDVSPFKAKL